MATIKILNKVTKEVLEFNSLDTALRNLKGIDSAGYKFNQPLLTKSGFKTYKETHGLMEHNGYSILQRAKNVGGRTKEDVIQKLIKMFILMLMRSPNEQEMGMIQTKMDSFKTPDEALTDAVKTFKEKLSQRQMNEETKKQIEQKLQEISEEDVKSETLPAVKDFKTEDNLGFKLKKEQPKHEVKKEEDEFEGEHFQFKILLELIKARVNALLVGPAGSGKTTAAEHVADRLGKKYFSISVGQQTTKTEFFGYMDATGKYVRTLFREAYENGGVFLIDEMDAGNANVLTAMNQALANEQCAFPDGMVRKHVDFTIVASANTYGTGANREYVGRTQLDAATLDRFAVVEWNYDEKIENKFTANKTWLNFVKSCRSNANRNKIRTVVSPRASFSGDKLLAAGMEWGQVVNMLIKKGLNDTEFLKVTEGLKIN